MESKKKETTVRKPQQANVITKRFHQNIWKYNANISKRQSGHERYLEWRSSYNNVCWTSQCKRSNKEIRKSLIKNNAREISWKNKHIFKVIYKVL